MQSKKLVILAFLSLFSCNLTNRSIFSQIGDFEKVEYNTDSPFYKSATTGVAGANGNLFVTSSRRLWRQSTDGNWSNITDSLPKPFNAAVDIVQLATGDIFVALSNKDGNILGLVNLNPADSSFGAPIGGIKKNQQPNFFFKTPQSTGTIASAYLYAQSSDDNPSAKYVYTTTGTSVGPTNERGSPPNASMRIIGVIEDQGTNFVVTETSSQSEQSQIWGQNKKPINIAPNYSIRLAGQIPVQKTVGTNPAVSALSGATFVVDLVTGKLKNDPKESLIGLSDSVQPNTYGYIDGTPVIATNFGYFETDSGKKLTFPTSKTTDTVSYSASQLGGANIRGVYTVNGKVYLTTWAKGLWVRDPVTKKWSSV